MSPKPPPALARPWHVRAAITNPKNELPAAVALRCLMAAGHEPTAAKLQAKGVPGNKLLLDSIGGPSKWFAATMLCEKFMNADAANADEMVRALCAISAGVPGALTPPRRLPTDARPPRAGGCPPRRVPASVEATPVAAAGAETAAGGGEGKDSWTVVSRRGRRGSAPRHFK
jgi:hypothetical protein